MNFLLILIPLLVGASVAIQGILNARLGHLLNHPLQAAIINFSIGLTALILISLLLKIPPPAISLIKSIPPLYFTGGLLGATFVTSAILLIPKIGVTTLLSATIIGELLLSLVIDHYGWLNTKMIPANLTRILGATLLILGFFLIQKSPQ